MIKLNLDKAELVRTLVNNFDETEDKFCVVRGTSVAILDTHSMRILLYLDCENEQLRISSLLLSLEQREDMTETLAEKYALSCEVDVYPEEFSPKAFIIDLYIDEEYDEGPKEGVDYQMLAENIVHNVTRYVNKK